MSRKNEVVARFRRGLVTVVVIALGSPLANAQGPARTSRNVDEPTPIASTRSSETVAASAGMLKASVRLDGTPSPGLRVTLDGTHSSGGRMWYRWLQTQGPKAIIDDATRPEAHVTVPPDASSLGFVLVVGNASGVDARALVFEVEDPERDSSDRSLKADAGDDQKASVGRKVVLNGVRSEPNGKIHYRWVQVDGPKVAIRANEGPTASFLPSSPGNYRFALVVSTAGGMISEPSEVAVMVGGSPRGSDDSSQMDIDELARVSLASIDGGDRLADDLSRAFDVVADGINSFRTFAEAIAETTRRLDSVVPRDKERRAVWIERLFTPLMGRIVAGMKSDGLDLTQPGAQLKAMNKDQRTRLAEQFRYAAAGLRAAKTVR